jgi:hypothetical protein
MREAATLRPQEAVLFEGDVVLLKSKLSVVETHGWITNQRLFIAEGSRTIEKPDIASCTEEKHGLDRKMVFGLRDAAPFLSRRQTARDSSPLQRCWLGKQTSAACRKSQPSPLSRTARLG